MAPVTLREVIGAAKARCVVLSAETAAYAVLAIADQAIQRPGLVVETDIELGADGTLWLRATRPCEDSESARSLRVLLAQLLSVSPGGGSALSSAARRRQRADGIGRFVGEVEAALIPVNRAAARRALARLHRETQRAKDQQRLVAMTPPARVADIQAPPLPLPPARTPRVADVELSSVVVASERPAFDVVPSGFELSSVEPASFAEIPIFVDVSATPFLGTVVTATRTPTSHAAEPDPPAEMAASHANASSPTESTGPAVVGFLVRTPHWPGSDVSEEQSEASDGRLCATAPHTPPMPLFETASLCVLTGHGPVEPPQDTVGATHDDGAAMTYDDIVAMPSKDPARLPPTPADSAPIYQPRRSDVTELLRAFVVSETRSDSELSRDLKRSIGMHATPPPPDIVSRTPPPVTSGEESSLSDAPAIPVSQHRMRRWAAGATALVLVSMGLKLRPTAAARAPTPEPCRAEIVIPDATPGSELRVRTLGGVEIRRLKANAAGPVVVSMLPCSEPLELLVLERGDAVGPKWLRVGVDAAQLTPPSGQNGIRHTIRLR